MKVKYLANIFPKSINDQIYNSHLQEYSKTLIDHSKDLHNIVNPKYHHLIPYSVYLCPLCLKNHFVKTDSGVVGTSEFSLDHLPPKNSGGTYKLITCKKCNNDSGKFEAELERVLNFAVDKSTPGAIKPFKVQVLDKKTGKFIQGFTHHKDGEIEIIFDEKLKKYRKDYVDFCANLHSNNSRKLALQIPLFNFKKVEQALLKSAYLLCFVWWGYEFVFSENGAFIREVLAGHKDYPCQIPFSWLENNEIRQTGISIVEDGKERLCFLVDIKLKGVEVITTATIPIPGLAPDGLGKIGLLDKMNKSTNRKALTCTTLPRIVNRIGYTISWRIVLPNVN